eukprot:1044610-Pyramimonas_sp.AAC.1
MTSTTRASMPYVFFCITPPFNFEGTIVRIFGKNRFRSAAGVWTAAPLSRRCSSPRCLQPGAVVPISDLVAPLPPVHDHSPG